MREWEERVCLSCSCKHIVFFKNSGPIRKQSNSLVSVFKSLPDVLYQKTKQLPSLSHVFYASRRLKICTKNYSIEDGLRFVCQMM